MKFLDSDMFGLFQSSKATVKSVLPKSKTAQILLQVRKDFNELQAVKKHLISAGLSQSKLPDDEQLLAFAYMNDHERDKQVEDATKISPNLLQQLTGISQPTSICTPVLRLLNVCEKHLGKIKTLHEQFLQAYENLPQLAMLHDKEVFCTDKISRSCWESKLCLQAEIDKSVSHLYLMFNRFAYQPAQLHTIQHDKHLSLPTDWLSDPFYMDEGNLIVLAKCNDDIKFKNIPMRLTGEVPQEKFSLY